MIALFCVLLLAISGLAAVGLARLLRDFVDRNEGNEPTFQDEVADAREVRSQFAWQSRSHFRAGD
jgi:hypothetical protein